MRRAYYELYIHVVWTTKNREAMIKEDIEQMMYQIIEEKCRSFKTLLIAKGNTEDHVHLFLAISPETNISMLIKEVKGATSYFINHKTNSNLYWQDSYGVLSVSKSGVEIVKKYVQNQREHHRLGNSLILALEKESCQSGGLKF